jgi:methylglutaconyl-CoA hydratase
MAHYDNIRIGIKGPVASLTLHREKVHNALNMDMIRDLSGAFKELDENREIRIIVMRAEGKHFSAGADLHWMKGGADRSREQLLSESKELSALFRFIHNAEHVVVASVRGKVMGGANGLIAASDIVVVEETAQFAFSEVRLGLIPATIAPYVLRKIGYSRSRELMLTGRLFDAGEAVSIGLAHIMCGQGKLEETVDELVRGLLSGGPGAMKGIKSLLDDLDGSVAPGHLSDYTAELIARFRTSEEGREGIDAFFEKRKPGWHETY